ncbi:MAG: T9SS type A sorting domain-containing protein [Bacteroidota bacterium]
MMKRFTVLMSCVLIAGMVFGQTHMQKRTKNFMKTKTDKIERSEKLEIIWEDDFSDPALWVTAYDDTNPNDGPWVIGTEGPSGYYSEAMGPIESTTADNGFAMYDSDATGVEVGSQDSKLILDGSIDCSTYESVAVTFESYYRAFNGNCYIEISTDSSTWEQFQVHDDIDVNSSTANPSTVTVNVTDFAANEPQVYFRFRYIGEWDYAWMVDDIKLFVAPDHDLQLMGARVNFFQYPHWIDETQYPLGDYYGYSGFFSMIPQNQVQNEDATIVFDGTVKNLGSLDATPSLGITVTDPESTEVFNNSATLDAPVSTEEKDTMPITDMEFSMPDALLGTYTWAFEAYEDGVVDENPADNTIEYQTEITQNIYAHDNDNVTGGWSTENYTDGGRDGDMIGVVYPFFEPDTIDQAHVYISSMTEVGASFKVKLLTMDPDTDEWTEFMASPPVTIEDTTQVGVFHEVEFPAAGVVEPIDGFTRVMVAVEYSYNNEASSFRLGIDGSAPTNGWETYMYFVIEDSWYYYGGDHVAVIRLETRLTEDNAVGMNEFTDFSVYPNPTNGTATISNVEGATIEVYNMLGKCVRMIENAEFQTDINLSDMAEGTYLVRVKTDKGVGMKKLNVVK